MYDKLVFELTVGLTVMYYNCESETFEWYRKTWLRIGEGPNMPLSESY